MISNFLGWRKFLFVLPMAVISLSLLTHSPRVDAKPSWKTTQSDGSTIKGRGKGRKRKTVLQEPVVQEPVVQEPVVQEPVVQEPVVQEPVVQEPVVVNEAPSINGSPNSSIYESGFYDFLPGAADPEGDTLIFSISNKPAWADFDPTTGALYGFPASADLGRYSSIGISVTDGQYETDLPAFSIDVLSAPLQAVTLNWQPPTENTDSTPLADLAGFRIYREEMSGQFVEIAELSNPGLSSYVVSDLAVGVWRFVMTAYNVNDAESPFSNISQFELSFP